VLGSYASGQLRGPMLIAAICERMGWDYHTYRAQPKWFLDLLVGKYDIDAHNEKRAQESMRK
jgi:hypothetical protein